MMHCSALAASLGAGARSRTCGAPGAFRSTHPSLPRTRLQAQTKVGLTHGTQQGRCGPISVFVGHHEARQGATPADLH